MIQKWQLGPKSKRLRQIGNSSTSADKLKTNTNKIMNTIIDITTRAENKKQTIQYVREKK